MAVDWSQAQAAVIGAALIDERCVPEILAEMRAEDFNGAFVRYFEAFRDLTAEKTPVDAVSVLSRIGPDYRELTRELIEGTPTSANFRAYVRICREQARLRLLRDLGGALGSAETLDEAREILTRAAAVSVEQANRSTVTSMELAAKWISALNEQNKPEYITCGVGCVDSVVRTVPGNYHIIAGMTSHGKSAFALQIAWHMAQTRKVGYFSNELQEDDFLYRLIAMAAPADQEHVRARDLTDAEMRATATAASEIFKARLSFEPAAGMTVDDIRARTLQRGYEVVFVDYLQLVRSPQQKYDRYRAVTEISSGLQGLAHSLGVAVIAMSQLSRQKDENGFEPVPPLSSLRESGQIEQDADAVIIVHAPMRKPYPRFRVLDIAKNRSGRIDRFFIDFRGDQQRFTAPSAEDYRIWSEVLRKKRVLTAEERQKLEDAAEEKQSRRMEAEQRKRYRQKDGGGDQTELPM